MKHWKGLRDLGWLERKAWGKGGGGSQTQSNQATEGQRELDSIAAQNARQLQPLHAELVASARNPLNNPQYYPGQTVADFNPVQQVGQMTAINQAGNLQTNVNPKLQEAMRWGLEDSREMNPYLQDYMRVATDPMFEQFQEQVLPQIGSTAQQQGAFGGVRQGLAEAQAAQDLARQTGDMRTKLAFEGYNKGIDTMLATMGMSPQLVQTMNEPSRILNDIGERIMTQEQAQIDAAVDRFNFEQDPDYQRYLKYAPIIGAFNSGQVSNMPASTKTKSSSGSSFLGK